AGCHRSLRPPRGALVARPADRYREDPDQRRSDPPERRLERRRGCRSMSDIHALSGAYPVDALDETARPEFELHLAECAACRAEVASFHETTALVAETETV